MFILSFPSKEIQEFLAVNSNLEKLKKAITRIKEPFNKYHGEDFCVYSVLNDNEEQSLCSFEKLNGLKDILVLVCFPTEVGNLGLLYLFINKAELHSLDVPLEGKKLCDHIEGTWDEVISEYLRFLKDRINI